MTYALVVAVLSVAGGALPLLYRPGHSALQLYISLAAGALLGAALFHLLPEASEHVPGAFGIPTIIGIVAVFLLQRYVAPHSHEPRAHTPHQVHQVNDHHGHSEHHPAAAAANHDEHRPYGPMWGGLLAILALSIHSFFDGVAIAAALGSAPESRSVALAVFLSVLIHKPMDSLSVSVLLVHAGVRSSTLWAVQLVYAALVPVGMVAFQLTRTMFVEPSPFLGYTLAFSAGTFLAIALTDLLPELHFHRHDRHKLSAALGLGILVMWLAGWLGHSVAHP